jgi:hypothetical protein
MPLSWYVQEILIREQLAEAQRRAAHERLVLEARRHAGRSDFWRRAASWLGRRATPRPVLVPQTKER